MRHSLVFAFVSAFTILLILTACTPPPQRPQPGTGQETRGDEGTTQTQGSTPEQESVQPSGIPGESVEPPGTQPAEGEETPAVPEDLFGHYSAWPPPAITDEEVNMLRRVVVVLETTKGTIRIRLFPDAAPIHCANFVKLVQEGFYDGSPFHRVLQDFMSQGGGRPDGSDAGYTLAAEISLPHKAGRVAAARLGDDVNPQRRSSGSQFYLVHTDESCRHLDGQYTVFGEIVQGQDVNLALTVTSPGAQPDSIIRAYVEMG